MTTTIDVERLDPKRQVGDLIDVGRQLDQLVAVERRSTTTSPSTVPAAVPISPIVSPCR